MGTRSKIALGAVLKNFRRVAQHPWIASKLATLQGKSYSSICSIPGPIPGRPVRSAN